MTVTDILQQARNTKGCSDVHLATNETVFFRVNGDTIEMPKFDTNLSDINEFENMYNIDTERDSQDFGFTLSDCRYRGHFFKKSDRLGKAVNAFTIRLLDNGIPSLDQLNLPEEVRSIRNLKSGLAIICGTTGSGKSTTLASICNEVNLSEEKNILTLEDPIEYIYPRGKSHVIQREIGSESSSFQQATKDALREAPDVILIGEMRDFDTIQNALTAAETGHVVLGSLHVYSVAEIPDRIISMYPGNMQEQARAQVVSSLRVGISQRLVKGVAGVRVPLCEVMVVNTAISAIIRSSNQKNGILDQIRQHSDLGSLSLETHAKRLLDQGLVTKEILEAAMSSEEFTLLDRKLKGRA